LGLDFSIRSINLCSKSSPSSINDEDEYKKTRDIDALYSSNEEPATTDDFEDKDGEIDELDTPPGSEDEGISKVKFLKF